MDDYRQGLGGLLPPIALDFFATFARFEFALKRGGFLAGELGRPAGANWDLFANLLGSPFFDAMRLDSRADVFFSAQPQKLMVIAPDEVEFQAPPAIVNSQQLFEALRLIRNNLFHGEKVYVGDRDEALMRGALFVLDAAFQVARQREDMRRMTTAFAYAAINPH